MTLDEEDIEAIVSRLVEVLPEALAQTEGPSVELVDASTVARRLGLSRAAVWRNARQLGGIQIGDGARPRWRFDLGKAIEAHEGTAPPRVEPPRRSPARSTVPRLPVHR